MWFTSSGFQFERFTWCNRREPRERIWEQLDRALAIAAWVRQHGDYQEQLLPMIGSDHKPIVLGSNVRFKKKKQGTFDFKLRGPVMIIFAGKFELRGIILKMVHLYVLYVGKYKHGESLNEV